MKNILTVLCILWTVPVFATNFGKISGKIVDAETGEALVMANVIVEGTQLGAATDMKGKFVILQVPPGSYSVRADMIGFKASRYENVVVRANRISTVNYELTPAVIDAQDIVIVAERPAVEKDVTATLRSVSEKEIENLPTSTVNDILRVQAGVVNANSGMHIRGGRSGEVAYYMDGIPMVDPLFSEIRSSEVINRDAISELQIISGTYSAEYGNAMSGIINISTKDGSNKIKANLSAKSSKPGLEKASRDNNRNILRGSVSGPFFSRKTNFFVSGSYDDRDNYLPWGYRTDHNIFAKLTDRHLQNLKFTAGLNYSHRERKSYSHAWKYIPEMNWREPESGSMMLQLGLTHTLTHSLYYTLQLYRSNYAYQSGDYDYNDLSPAYQRDENKEFYRLAYVSSFEKTDQTTMGIKGDLLWQANNYNEVKFGFEFKQHKIDRFYISSPYYDDHLLDDYVRQPREGAAYIQDKINFASIILSAGLRFDMTDPRSSYWPSPYDAFYERTENLKTAGMHTQISPRLGISYPVSDKTVFHFGYGHYFQRPEYQFIYKSLSDANYDQNTIMILRTGNGRFGNPDLKPEKTIAYEFGLGHQPAKQYLLNVSVYSKKITHLVGGRSYFPGTNSDIWETYSLHINEDFAYNNGLELQVRKTRGRFLFGEINYTYAVAEGSSSGPLERVGVEEANRQTLKFFPLDFDQRHTVNAYLSLRFAENDGPSLAGARILQKFNLTLLFQYGSGLAYTKGIRGATEPYELNNGRLPENWTMDLKITRQIRLGAVTVTPFLEVYNLTDRKNVVSVDPFTGRPDYSFGRTYEWAADPENWGPPRLVYLGLNVNL